MENETLEEIKEKLIRLTDNDDSELYGREEAVQEIISVISNILETHTVKEEPTTMNNSK
jgi:hypothetical protein